MTERKVVTKKKRTVKRAPKPMDHKPVQTDIEPEYDLLVYGCKPDDEEKMLEVARKHFNSMSPSNDAEWSLMRVFLNLLNKGFERNMVVDYTLEKAKEMGLIQVKRKVSFPK